MGKGSIMRPRIISKEQYNKQWENTFKHPIEKEKDNNTKENNDDKDKK